MSINLSKKQAALAVVAAIMVMGLSFVLGSHSVEPIVEVQEAVKYVEVIPQENFDTSVLESWDGFLRQFLIKTKKRLIII